MAKGLALIFGKPSEKSKEDDGDSYDSDIPADFRDHCDAAFEALKDKDSKAFCEEIWLAIKAYEETPHEEKDEETDEDEENEDDIEKEM